MTLQELEQIQRDILVPADIAPILGCTPYSINIAVRNGKNPFPFPVIVMNKRVRIPRIPFIKAMKGEF